MMDISVLGSQSKSVTGNGTLATGNWFSIPADRRLVQVDVHLLGFEIFLNAPRSKLAAETRLLVASPRRFHVGRLHVVHPNDSGAQSLHRAHSLEYVASPDGRRQAIRRIV